MQVEHTAAEIGREPNEETLSPALREAFDRELNEKLVRSVTQLVRPQLAKLGHAGKKVDSYTARELVLNALTDTYLGRLSWDPTSCSLACHVFVGAVSRASKATNHAIANPHDVIHDGTAAARRAEGEASKRVGDPELPLRRIYARETLALIRAEAEAAGDKTVLRMLDAYSAGAETRDDILVRTRMKEHTYHAAHARMKRIVQRVMGSHDAPKAQV